ncbi:hypothetical protein HAX54_018605, partial [Datura stramonium]|nr:hypothetical protein [Datura stramonium]
ESVPHNFALVNLLLPISPDLHISSCLHGIFIGFKERVIGIFGFKEGYWNIELMEGARPTTMGGWTLTITIARLDY